jgi:hypothetical protein
VLHSIGLADAQRLCAVARLFLWVTSVAEVQRLCCGSNNYTLLVERGAGSTGVDCPSITWSVGLGVGCYPAVVHILDSRIPFTRMWTIWTTTSGLQSGRILTSKHQQGPRWVRRRSVFERSESNPKGLLVLTH